MSYIGLTLPRKPKRRGRITQLQESSIYSTLSKKPAGSYFPAVLHPQSLCSGAAIIVLISSDLETTDIDLSAVRIFLGYADRAVPSLTLMTKNI